MNALARFNPRLAAILLLVALASASLASTPPTGQTELPPASPGSSSSIEMVDAETELETLQDLYRTVTSYQLLLAQPAVGEDLVTSLVFDVSHYVDEMDSRYEMVKLFLSDPRMLRSFEQLVAKAHLQAALMHAEGIDMESSIRHYRRAVELLGESPAEWGEGIEFFGKQGELPDANEMVFRIASVSEVMKRLEEFWSSGCVTRFQVDQMEPGQRRTLKLIAVSTTDDAHAAAVSELAAKRFATRVSAGLEEFEVVLPPGRFRVVSDDGSIPALDFQVSTEETPDPITLNPNTFSFAVTSPDDSCTPELIHNGFPEANLEDLTYGTFTVLSPASCERRLPDKIIVEQGQEVTLRTEPERLDLVREGQPILLFITIPAGETYNLRF